jgi:hypothetical protein
MKRCYYYQRPNCPVTVIRSSTAQESAKAIMSIKECYNFWKNFLGPICIIQRYIYPADSRACKYRVEYSIKDNSMTVKSIKNPINIYSSAVVNIEQKFFVRDSDCCVEPEPVNNFIKAQMETLRVIIESEENKNQNLSFIVADFLQDNQSNWYFFNVVNYRFENLLPKILPKKPKKVKRLAKNLAVKSLPQLDITNSNIFVDLDLQFKETLKQEVLRDLQDDVYNI